MTTPPPNPCVYHITHVNNLPAILASGGLVSDAAMIALGEPAAEIGMSKIKLRRLALPVNCHPGLNVGDFVPFYFCPRSIMLYVIRCANHPDLSYRGGQEPIVHLEADLHAVIAWATQQQRRWAFSLSNAGATYAEFRSRESDLGDVDWTAVGSTNFSKPTVKEGKQAEFLLHGDVPWSLVTRIGVKSLAIQAQARTAMVGVAHQPSVSVQPTWYY